MSVRRLDGKESIVDEEERRAGSTGWDAVMKEMEIDGKGEFLEDGRVEAEAVAIFPLGDGVDEYVRRRRGRCEFDVKKVAEDIIIIRCEGRGWVVDDPDTGTGDNRWVLTAAVKVVEDVTCMVTCIFDPDCTRSGLIRTLCHSFSSFGARVPYRIAYQFT